VRSGEEEARVSAHSFRRAAASTAGILGELLITLGLVLALFVVYSLWWTNVLADRQAGQDAAALRRAWAGGPHQDAAPPHGYAAGDGIGFLHIPRLGPDFSVLIKMGTDDSVLNEGVAGVYQQPYQAAMPWAPSGNFALAAHRDGHGAKFHDLPQLRPGDPVVVETRATWYVYTVDRVLPQTSAYDVDVIAPVPTESGYTRPGRYLTLTTCTPAYTSLYRMAVWAHLARTQPVDAARDLPAELR
jgi:sortase A